jgi:hypothetical protein
MNAKALPTTLHLKENLKGRIENLAMSPSYANTLIPVFEAIMNSIHAVQDRFGDQSAKKGVIHVTVHQDQDGTPTPLQLKIMASVSTTTISSRFGHMTPA